MKTEILFAVRCTPTKTQKLLQSIEGSGTAFITELIRNKKGEQIVNTKGYIRVTSFEELKKGAQKGLNVIYKTASLSRCAKFYVQKEIK